MMTSSSLFADSPTTLDEEALRSMTIQQQQQEREQLPPLKENNGEGHPAAIHTAGVYEDENKSEDSPLILLPDNQKKQQRHSSRRLRSSVARSFFHGVVKRAFSISYSGGGRDDDDDNDDADNEDALQDSDEDGYHNAYVANTASGGKWYGELNLRWIVVGILLLAALVMTGTFLLFPFPRYRASHPSLASQPSSSSSSSSCPSSTSDLPPSILALKSTSSIEDLPHGAVASDHPVCSKVGRDIMELMGGNAVDAAVATLLCLGVANPASSGLGGGAFILIHSNRTHFMERQQSHHATPDFVDARDDDGHDGDSDGSFITEVIDCRETAPAHASRDMYGGLPNTASAIGGLAIAVPGELRGLELAHARHGKIPWKDVVEPARRLATDGVAVGGHLASDIHWVITSGLPTYGDSPSLRKYLTTDGKVTSYLKEGDIIRNPGLGRTLAAVAEGGGDALYTGERARIIAEDVQKNGGILTMEDLVNYRPTIRSPVHAEASGYTLVGVPPPSSGGAVVIGAVRFLAGYSAPFAAAKDTLSVHRTVEAMRHVSAIRMSLSDPDYNGNVTKDAVQDLLRGDYMESLRRLSRDNDTLPLSLYGGTKWAQMHDVDISNQTQDAHEGDRRRQLLRHHPNHQRGRRLARPFGYLDDSGTSHLSVVDSEGNAVAVTSSVNGLFGSWVFSEETGVTLGNTMDDFGVPGKSNFFGLKPSEANFIAPGKKVCIYVCINSSSLMATSWVS